jgi:hypothetical protein
MLKYRDHRGSLDASMETVQEFSSKQELLAYLNTNSIYEVTDVKFVYAGYDPRINWNTWYVLEHVNEWGWIVVGMSDEKF